MSVLLATSSFWQQRRWSYFAAMITFNRQQIHKAFFVWVCSTSTDTENQNIRTLLKSFELSLKSQSYSEKSVSQSRFLSVLSEMLYIPMSCMFFVYIFIFCKILRFFILLNCWNKSFKMDLIFWLMASCVSEGEIVLFWIKVMSTLPVSLLEQLLAVIFFWQACICVSRSGHLRCFRCC